MKVESAQRAKGRFKFAARKIPGEGSLVREVYDLFQANKGVPVRVKRAYRAIADLTDYYGMDIVTLETGKRIGFGTYTPALRVFAGEWFGDKYVDYIAARL